MSKLFDQAIAQARTLSDDRQDELAEALFASIAGDHRTYALTPAQVEDVRRIRDALRSGGGRLATDEELSALWSRCGL